MSPKQCRVPSKHCHLSQDETGRESRGGEGQSHRHREEKMDTRRKRERGAQQMHRVREQAGRQREGVRKDKARGETVAGFKGCRQAWPWRSHEVYGCVMCWVFAE